MDLCSWVEMIPYMNCAIVPCGWNFTYITIFNDMKFITKLKVTYMTKFNNMDENDSMNMNVANHSSSCFFSKY